MPGSPSAEPAAIVIGWRETVSLPGWQVTGMVAKADTGARSSAIDVLDFQELPGDRVRFHIALSRRHRDRERAVEVVAPIVRRSRVRSAHGTTQDRLFVETDLCVGGACRRIELGLVCRRQMICRMLIGRSALAGTFLVDAGLQHVISDHPRRRRKTLRKKKATGSRPAPGQQP